MATKDFVIDDSCDRETVETIRECFPKFYRKSTFAFVIKSVNSVYGGAFVIASEEEKVFRVLDLVGEKQTDRLKRLLPSVDVVAKEKVIRLGRKSSVFKETQKVGVLTMDISADFEGGFEFKEDGLRQEDVSRSETESSDFSLCHLHRLPWSASSDLQQTGHKRVDIQFRLLDSHHF